MNTAATTRSTPFRLERSVGTLYLSRRHRLIRNLRETFIELMLLACGLVSIFTTISIVLVLAVEAFGFFREVPLSNFLFDTEWTPLFLEKHFGIMPLISGTLLVAFIALIVAIPIGLLIAVYLSEFATPRVRSIFKPTLEVLAGIPTVVYGYFALLFITPLLQQFIPTLSGFNALSPGIVVGIMILPLVASLSEDALYAVPQSLRDASYALGAGKLQMVFSALVPAALGGIIASFILAMSRAVGETMIVTIAAGQQPNITLNPLESVETMTAYIVKVSLGDTPHGTLEYKTLFAVGASLFVLTLILNSVSLWMRRKFQRSLTH